MAKRRITDEQLQEDASTVGVVYVRRYVNGDKIAVYNCPTHGDVELSPRLVAQGYGCKLCRNEKYFVQVVENAKKVGLEFVGPYSKACNKTLYLCQIHGELLMTPNAVLAGCGCKYCAPNKPKDLSEVIGEAEQVGLKFVGPYLGMNYQTKYECPEHGEVLKSPSWVYVGQGCPKCANYGFSYDKPAYLYVCKVYSENLKYLGFGITADLERRLTTHQRSCSNGGYTLETIKTFYYKRGQACYNAEREIIRTVPITDTGVYGFKREATYEEYLPMIYSIAEKHLDNN